MIENCLFPSHCANFYSMGEKSWLRRRIKDGLHRGFQHAYETVKVDPARFLVQLRAAYGLPITNLQGVYSVETARLDDLATRFIRSGMKVAAVEGAGLGERGHIFVRGIWKCAIGWSKAPMRFSCSIAHKEFRSDRRMQRSEVRMQKWNAEVRSFARVFILHSDFSLLHYFCILNSYFCIYHSVGLLHHTCQSSTAQLFSSTLMECWLIPPALFPGCGGDGPQKTALIQRRFWR